MSDKTAMIISCLQTFTDIVPAKALSIVIISVFRVVNLRMCNHNDCVKQVLCCGYG